MAMIDVFFAIAVCALAGLALLHVWPDIEEWRRRRAVVRDSYATQHILAQRAATQLSLLAWRARRELWDLANDSNGWGSSDHPARRDESE
jgi:hypothetical protein